MGKIVFLMDYDIPYTDSKAGTKAAFGIAFDEQIIGRHIFTKGRRYEVTTRDNPYLGESHLKETVTADDGAIIPLRMIPQVYYSHDL